MVALFSTKLVWVGREFRPQLCQQDPLEDLAEKWGSTGVTAFRRELSADPNQFGGGKGCGSEHSAGTLMQCTPTDTPDRTQTGDTERPTTKHGVPAEVAGSGEEDARKSTMTWSGSCVRASG